MLAIFKIVSRLRDRHVFIDNQNKSFKRFQYFERNLKEIFWKTKTFFKKLGYCFLVETTRIENNDFNSNLRSQQPMLRQIEWRLQNAPVTKSGVWPATALSFW